MPTSLTYVPPIRPEALHLGDLLRFSVRLGTVHTPLRWIFTLRGQATRRGPTPPRSSAGGRPPRVNPFPGARRRQQEKTSLPGPAPGVSSAPPLPSCCRPVRESQPASFSGVPGGRPPLPGPRPPLNPDSPVADYPPHGTLPLFSPQTPPLSTCYSHQDRHRGPLHAGSPRRFRAAPAPTYWDGAPPPPRRGSVPP